MDSAPASGGRRHKHSAKKLRLVKKKTVRRMLAKKGLRMRGGEPTKSDMDAVVGGGPGPALAPAPTGGRRRRHGKTHRRRGKSLFGMKF
jgi:hypothetical protein